MRSFNQVLLYGNLTADPEVKVSKTGKPFSTFSLATNRGWKNKSGENVKETDFHRIVAFGRLGEITGTHLKKGRAVILSGRLSNRSYTTQEGTKKYISEVVLDDFNFLPSGKRATAKQEAVAA